MIHNERKPPEIIGFGGSQENKIILKNLLTALYRYAIIPLVNELLTVNRKLSTKHCTMLCTQFSKFKYQTRRSFYESKRIF